MTDEDDDIEVEFTPDIPEDVMHGPDGALDCLDGRYGFAEYWLAKLGVEPTGSAVTFGEGCSVAILHPITGVWMTPEQIAKKAGSGNVRTIN